METIKIVGNPLFQWELGRKIQLFPLPDMEIVEVHFSNQGDDNALVVKPREEDGMIIADIPNILLQSGNSLVVYSVNTAKGFSDNLRSTTFPVRKKARPSSYVYTETETLGYRSLEKRIDEIEKKGLSEEKIATAVEQYLENNPIQTGATEEEAAQIKQNKEDIERLDKDKLSETDLDAAIDSALAQAKESGEFNGKDGQSPTATVTQMSSGATITVTDKNGTTTATVKNGDPGKTAYEYAKDGGYVGTEIEFSAKLAKEYPTKVSELTNDEGYITSSEVPVKSVNGKTGAVTLNASEVGALPSGTKIPARTSELTNDSGFITGYTETDPTVPAWAKAESKPQYTKTDIGLGNVENVRQYSASNQPPYPVTSVNGETGAVTLTAEDVNARSSSWMPTADQVGARPNTWTPSATDVGAVPTSRTVNGKKLNVNITLTASDVGALPNTYTPPDQTAEQVGADPVGTAENKVSTHNTSTTAHNDIRQLITGLTTRLNALANSDDETLDQMKEVVDYIKENRDLIEQITTGKVGYSDIVDDLTTNVSEKPLSAAQGVALKALIDAITVPTKVSQLTNDSKFITASGAPVQSVNGETGTVQLTASDVGARSSSWMPSASQVGAVPVERTINKKSLTADIELSATDVGARPSNWTPSATDVGARPNTWTPSAADVGAVPTSRTINNKPLSDDVTLTASDVGARSSDWTPTKANIGLGNVDNVKQYSASNPPPYPVTSVNGNTGAVTLDAAAVGARPSNWTPSASEVGAVPTSRAITITGVDADGVSHSWTMYGVAQ